MPGMFRKLLEKSSSPSPAFKSSNKLWVAPLESIFKGKESVQAEEEEEEEESENYLADMVQEFMEDDGAAHDGGYDNEADGSARAMDLFITLPQTISANTSPTERELKRIVTKLLMGASESELICQNLFTDCKGSCIRGLLVKLLLAMYGYNASVCKTKWQKSGKVPGGEYEYVDVRLGEKERVIIDIDFRCQFEIARPSQNFQKALKALPVIFVGKSSKLEQVVKIMCEAAKGSLRQNLMHIPPWRTVEYMTAKWFSSYERNAVEKGCCSSATVQCREQLVRLKGAINVEMEKASPVLKSIINGSYC